ncbi:MAG: DUF3078 domain-containing protein [Alphaproteobacteria bacterium]|nr:DUF3078 domain-containing protein [Alphaproteobacteria bacterium]MBO4644059.1 DUF3078 domain-containing protein [Alphaproteobacteria bacterium]
MSLKKTLLPLCALLISFQANAQENTASAPTLKANFRRVGLEMSSTSINHSREYKNSPVTQLSTDSQTVVKGVFDFMLEYNRENLQWNNGVYAEYGETKVKPVDQEAEKNESADKILFSSDYAHKLFEFGGLKFGPMATVEYQTEFTANEGAPRTKVARGKAGLKLFDGDIIKSLYIAAVGEYDMTYKPHVSKSAAEFGWRLEDTPREGVQYSTEGYFRRYLSYNHYIGTDLIYDLNATARMDVQMNTTLTFGPYMSYRYARSREAHVSGSNFTIGVAFTYKDLFNLM